MVCRHACWKDKPPPSEHDTLSRRYLSARALCVFGPLDVAIDLVMQNSCAAFALVIMSSRQNGGLKEVREVPNRAA